ncbi:MAG: hypothetical protein JOY66_07870 [Acetobacteraceae bacterium]|nr:hypothetical protein [Acetobacteraceae bacterium]
MHVKTRLLAALVACVAVLVGATEVAPAQNATAEHPPVPGAAPPTLSGPGWGPEAYTDQSPDTTATADLPVLYVTSVEVLRSSAEPELDIVRVTGLVSSEGWSAPLLVPTYAGKPFDGVLDLELIATPPEQSEGAGGFVPVSAVLSLEPGRGIAGVRVRGSENAITVKQIPGAGHASISVNDCRACAGQKFAPEGTVAQPQQNVVRQEDLPKFLRVIKEGEGIRGVEHDPNRLSLILGADNTILRALWE